MCPGGPMTLRRYGDLGGRACDDGGEPPCESIGGGGVTPGIAAALACWLPTSRATDHRNASQGKGTPRRLRATKSRSMVGT